MKALMNALSPSQQVWFADLMIQAIWADQRVALREYEYFLRLASSLEDKLSSSRLVRRLERGNPRAQAIPRDFPKELLPQIYMEVVSLVVCDWDLDPRERRFLEDLSRRFGFEANYHAHLIEWAEQGLSWQVAARNFLPESLELKHKWVPVHQMSQAQQVWYAEVLVGVMLIDGITDPLEVKLLKKALYFLPAAHKKRLTGHFTSRLRPPLLSPPSLNRETVFQVLFEVLEIIGLNEEISPKEADFLGDFIRVCNLPRALEQRCLDWCEQGIFWRQQRRALGHQVRFANGPDALPVDRTLWRPHPQTSQVLVREQSCFICGDQAPPVLVHRLSTQASKGRSNFFGVVSYPLELLGESAEADFNGLRVHFCPSCLFASPRKELFRATSDDAVPSPFLQESFLKEWRDGSQHRLRLDRALLKEQGSLAPSPHWVRSLYQLAIDSHKLMLNHHASDENRWSLISLQLTLGEQLMNQGQPEEADAWVEAAADEARQMVLAAQLQRWRLKAHRLLFKVALYQGDSRAAGAVIDQLVRLRIEKGALMNEADRNLLGATLSESRRDFAERNRFAKELLQGFHLREAPGKAIQEA
ncbi:MAG: hypothetical protein RRB13_16070 [bacterium]|nr:hypothetical protein [bacterium]